MAKLLPSLGDGLQHKESYGVGSPIGEARRTLLSSHNVPEHNVPDSERRLREILDALPAAVYTTDADGRVTMFNVGGSNVRGSQASIGHGHVVRHLEALSA